MKLAGLLVCNIAVNNPAKLLKSCTMLCFHSYSFLMLLSRGGFGKVGPFTIFLGVLFYGVLILAWAIDKFSELKIKQKKKKDMEAYVKQLQENGHSLEEANKKARFSYFGIKI